MQPGRSRVMIQNGDLCAFAQQAQDLRARVFIGGGAQVNSVGGRTDFHLIISLIVIVVGVSAMTVSVFIPGSNSSMKSIVLVSG